MILHALFILAAFVVFYTYLGYPLLLALLTLRRRPQVPLGPALSPYSVVIAARNEAASIGRRTREFLTSPLRGELIIVSDGSTDATAAAVRTAAADCGASARCQVIELPRSLGKAAALSAGCARARGDILIFADARQSWAPDALPQLLALFADPHVGGVSGELILGSAPGVLAGVGLYWRYEKWIRCRESARYAMVGATGAISAVRRTLFTGIPAGTILDDVYWPLRVVMQGHRVVHTRTAVAFDRLPPRAAAEFRRKVRTMAGNWQLLALLPAAVLPWRNRIWWQYLSHKLLRLCVPWLLLTLLFLCLAIGTPLFLWLLAAQLACYALAFLGLIPTCAARIPLASAAASFVVLNVAAAAGLLVWLTGRHTRAWNQTSYAPPPAPALEATP